MTPHSNAIDNVKPKSLDQATIDPWTTSEPRGGTGTAITADMAAIAGRDITADTADKLCRIVTS